MPSLFKMLTKGLSLKKNNSQQLQLIQSSLLPRTPQPRLYKSGKFNESDSQEQDQKSRCGVTVKGQDPTPVLSNFTKIQTRFKLKKYLLKNLAAKGVSRPTPIQMALIPAILQQRSVIATAPTGSGKTIAFAIPILQLLNAHSSKGLRAIVLANTHQLGIQLFNQLQFLSQIQDQRRLIVSRGDQYGSDCDVLVTTPFRLISLIQKQKQLLAHLKIMVMDQSDKYFQQSFSEQIVTIIEAVKQRSPQLVLLSATIQHPVQSLLKQQLLHRPLRINFGHQNTIPASVSYRLQYCSNQQGKLIFLKNLIIEGGFLAPVLIFTQSKERAQQLNEQLRKLVFTIRESRNKVHTIHSDKHFDVRQRILKEFQLGEIWALVTTDLLARGIDFKIINYDVPPNILTFIHRAGRTGRNQRKGSCYTLFTDVDRPIIRSIANLMKQSGLSLPEWFFSIKRENIGQDFIAKREAISRDPRHHCDPVFEHEKRVMDAKFYRKLKRDKE